MEGTGISTGEALLLNDRRDGYGYGDGMMGFGGGWWIWIILLFFIFGGWNNRGENRGGAMEGIATREAVNSGFQYSQLDNGIRGVQNGLCDGFYAMNNAIKDGFYGTTGSVKDAAYELSAAIKDCCCTTNRNIDAVRYDMSKGFCDVIQAGNLNTRDILESQNAGVQKILDYMCANEKQALRDRISTLETSGIIQAQTQNLVNTLRPCPIPAYQVCNPFTGTYATGLAGLNGFGFGTGCGCGGFGV